MTGQDGAAQKIFSAKFQPKYAVLSTDPGLIQFYFRYFELLKR